MAGISIKALPRALVLRNLATPPAAPESALRERFRELDAEEAGARVAGWADFFLEWGKGRYLLGENPGGYVTEGRLVDDLHTDCMLFVCRVIELAASGSPEEAIAAAIQRRFPRANPSEIVWTDGRIDYAHPRRIAQTWDLIENGSLGEDMSEEIGPLVPDPGTRRYPAGRVRFVAGASADLGALAGGDIIHFVLDETHAGARQTREDTGTVIGHMGIAVRQGATAPPALVHAASHDLPGEYEGGRVVRVDLATYLRRVERFKGIIVTRLRDEDGAA